MAENRLATTVAQGYRRLGMRGQPLIAAHSQLAQILRNRLGREHAELFARPNLDPTTGSIEWFTSRAGAPALVSTLDAQQRASLEALTEQLLREVEQLAGKLKREGDTAELASQMLGGALQRPPGDWLYEVDGKPVLIMWGHVPEGGANMPPGAAGAAVAPTGASAPSSAPSSTASSMPTAVDAGAAAATVPAAMAGSSLLRRWWWLWLLLALLLLLLMLRQCMAPVDPLTIGSATIPPPPTTPAIDDALARQRALLEELSRQRQARLDGVRALECVRVQPDAPALVPGPAGGITTTGPDGGGAGIGGAGIIARPGAATGPAADAEPPGPGAASPDATAPGGDPGRTGVPADATPAHPGRALPPVALSPEGPVDPGRLPELPPPDTGKPLTIPPDAPRDGKPSFLQGNWSAGPGLTSTKNKPIDLSLVLGDDGKGQVVIRRKDDGSTCVGPVDAQMRQGRLAVTGSGAVLCNRGEPFEMPRFECAPDARGRTQCNGINRDGSTYEMDIYQGRRS